MNFLFRIICCKLWGHRLSKIEWGTNPEMRGFSVCKRCGSYWEPNSTLE